MEIIMLKIIITTAIFSLLVSSNATAGSKAKIADKLLKPAKITGKTSIKHLNSQSGTILTPIKVNATGARLRNSVQTQSVNVSKASLPVIKERPRVTTEQIRNVGQSVKNTLAVKNIPIHVKLRSMQENARVTFTTPKGRYEIDTNLKGRNGKWPSHNGLMTPHTKFSPINKNAPSHVENKFNTSNKFAKYYSTPNQEIIYAKKLLENRRKKRVEALKKLKK
jgi:hypothetical protein